MTERQAGVDETLEQPWVVKVFIAEGTGEARIRLRIPSGGTFTAALAAFGNNSADILARGVHQPAAGEVLIAVPASSIPLAARAGSKLELAQQFPLNKNLSSGSGVFVVVGSGDWSIDRLKAAIRARAALPGPGTFVVGSVIQVDSGAVLFPRRPGGLGLTTLYPEGVYYGKSLRTSPSAGGSSSCLVVCSTRAESDFHRLCVISERQALIAQPSDIWKAAGPWSVGIVPTNPTPSLGDPIAVHCVKLGVLRSATFDAQQVSSGHDVELDLRDPTGTVQPPLSAKATLRVSDGGVFSIESLS